MSDVPSTPDPLYMLAFDHRDFFQRELVGTAGPLDTGQTAAIADAKNVIFDGLLEAGAALPHDQIGLLVDGRFGGALVARAREHGLLVAMPAERSGRAIFEFADGDAFGEEIARADPDMTKVLVRYNVDGDAAGNRVQAERLRRLCDWLRSRGRPLLFELIVEPTADQLRAHAGVVEAFEADLRPELIRRAVAELQRAGVEPAIWKVEGIADRDDAAALVQAVQSGGRDDVRCIVLGSGAPAEQVETWLRTAARTDGYAGFAIGRSIWWPPLRALRDGEIDRPEAVTRIARAYLRFVDAFASARAESGSRA